MHAIRVHLGGHDVDEVMNCDELIKERDEGRDEGEDEELNGRTG